MPVPQPSHYCAQYSVHEHPRCPSILWLGGDAFGIQAPFILYNSENFIIEKYYENLNRWPVLSSEKIVSSWQARKCGSLYCFNLVAPTHFRIRFFCYYFKVWLSRLFFHTPCLVLDEEKHFSFYSSSSTTDSTKMKVFCGISVHSPEPELFIVSTVPCHETCFGHKE